MCDSVCLRFFFFFVRLEGYGRARQLECELTGQLQQQLQQQLRPPS